MQLQVIDQRIKKWNTYKQNYCTIKEIENETDMENVIKEIRRIDIKMKNGTTPRPNLMKFVSGSKKMEVLKAAKRFQGSDIWISEDYSKQVQEQRKKLAPYMKEALIIEKPELWGKKIEEKMAGR